MGAAGGEGALSAVCRADLQDGADDAAVGGEDEQRGKCQDAGGGGTLPSLPDCSSGKASGRR